MSILIKCVQEYYMSTVAAVDTEATTATNKTTNVACKTYKLCSTWDVQLPLPVNLSTSRDI